MLLSQKMSFKLLLQKLLLFLLISIALEFFLFNRAAIFSRFGSERQELGFTVSDGLAQAGNGLYYFTGKGQPYLELSGMNGALKYIHVDIDCRHESGNSLPFTVTVAPEDEGNSYYYFLPRVTCYAPAKKSTYFYVHTYGDVSKARIYLAADEDTSFQINSISSQVVVPCFFSWGRALCMFILLLLLWNLRPSSAFYHMRWTRRQKYFLTAAVLLCNICVLGVFSRLNTAYLNPVPPHHSQYHKLAVALTEGKTYIETGIEEALSQVPNPYDSALREHFVDEAPGWDTAFYKGHFYVYFGIVPVLLFYLPWYLLFQNTFPTWLGIFITGSLLLVGVFYLMLRLIKRFFPDTPFMVYLLLSLAMGNGIGTLPAMLRPDFYWLPILCAICFTVWGLAFWVRATELWGALQVVGSSSEAGQSKLQRRLLFSLLAGSFCMALTAGCRPQFLIGSFLIFPLFFQNLQNEKAGEGLFTRQNFLRVFTVLLPYVIIAAGLMYYNAIRFGSVFDFGASYNITTNDMTHRGFHIGRIPEGIVRYLLQFPSLGLRFPYVENISLSTDYVGITIQEYMFGGIFFTHIFLMVSALLGSVSDSLRKKRLYTLSLCCLLFGLVIVIADTELAGILSRYYADFLWIFFIPAVLVFLQLWENIPTKKGRQRLILFLLSSLLCGLFMDFFIGIQAGELRINNIHRYYMIREFFR